jgi:enterobactin synthetase component D
MEASGDGRGWRSPFSADIQFAEVELDHVDLELIRADPIASRELMALGEGSIDARRLEFAAGRAAARQALDRLGAERVPVLIGGRREPKWPTGTVGTITHSDGVALAAAGWRTQWSGLGLDIESLDRYFPDLLAMITSEPERVGLGPLLSEIPDRATVAVFAAKEALYKALFPQVGKLFGFDVAHVRPGAKPGSLTIELLDDLAPDVAAGTSYVVQTTWHPPLVLASLAIEAT